MKSYYMLGAYIRIVSVWIFTDVGMMMMQTGMVKQSLNTYRGCLDGTETKWQIYRITVPYTRIVCLHQLTIAMDELKLGYNILC